MELVSTIRWKDDRHFQLREMEFALSEKVIEGVVCMKKNRSFIEEYVKIHRSLKVKNVVEVGVLWGGSTVFLNELFRPEHLLAIDIKDQTQPFFKDYMAVKGGQTIVAELTTSQDKKRQISLLIEREFGLNDLDLVIDDASHLYPQSVATFETLFPRLRAEGVYVLEDWGWAHWPGMWQTAEAPWGHQLSLGNMVLELSMACASKRDVIRRVEVTPTIVIIHRGAGDGTNFTLGSAFHCRGRDYHPSL